MGGSQGAVHCHHVTVLLLTPTLLCTEDFSQEQPVGIRNLFCFPGFVLDSLETCSASRIGLEACGGLSPV